ncbi:GtrA family protein [Mesorhizobium sp. M2D.F.Ca.ET.185.01.1.1]|uniref:GtrA family protein n=1 Tax=unclassified Mesorhizobium TaxID=325217 RepID=UPI000FCAA48F|nr:MULTISPECIES: GtrA family protein [unclassified Mesorhizobium]NUS21040.1 GtrA family protein [Mesorhizobium sp.]TGP55567.1 GtrA family protein [bacterium M00.F.Ca.ET.230.01.1.1]TGP82714.1 GtrA family protein [bacterium M00.F.Ca.ET.227.01.1.1]TGP94468.1 GtrA family protein [bacterium M00.F.Ca.ET.221.01.1.1]TGP97921.1 GtrA family protein [bacterium M00.F.Ca.ET.222.01.1.1]TGT74980.1 GtrA family protein [bacterium M00.F.Ca.ET.159.01.1.1]TGT87847.1 GtrA family protein [bacterium M00.F.Ca.ET.15
MSSAGQPQRSTGDKIVRFALVGLVNTGIDLTAFFLLLKLAAPALAANVGAWLAAVLFSFVANRFWSFERDPGIRLHHSFLRFVSLGALISLGVSSLSIAVLAGAVGVWPAKIIGVVIAAVLNFLAARWSIEGKLLG